MISRVSLTCAASMVLLGVSVSAVPPEPPPPQSSGPDVVVSGIGSSSGSSPYGDSAGGGVTTNGSVGDITAYSVGTVSCNIGNANAIWIDSSGPGGNQHPVIGTQIYRYRVVNGAGRFDQLGLNWLKHGFCAADSANCGSLISPPGAQASAGGCDWLGLFATDTYGAGLNGSQGSLGPRSEVNPWTGAFPYPYILQAGASGNAVFKRTQVRTADLVAGANYIVEVVYICTDEPVSNRFNNYSYRTGSVSGTTLSLGGSTETMRPAIVGWKEKFDNAVTIIHIDPTPGTDGRLVLGYKVTQTSPSTWHYEYNVFNMNNDASVRSFSVPVASTVTMTDIEFRDVAYHSGEPYDGTDWTYARGGGTASWFTSTFAQNVNANAIRWGTMYSFRFDANIAPATGNITLGMFKSGQSVTVAAQVPGVPPPPVPGPFALSSPAPSATTASLSPKFTWAGSSGADTYTITVATDSALSSAVSSASGLVTTNWTIPPGVLTYGATYHWGVTSVNGAGATMSSPASQTFQTPPPPCTGDLTGDGHTNTADLTVLLGSFGQTVPPGTSGDLTGDGQVNTSDLAILLGAFGC